MKTSFTFITLLGTTMTALAQGEVYFANTAATVTHIQTNNIPFSTVGTGRIKQPPGDWTFALFCAPSSVNDVDRGWDSLRTPWLDPDWQFTGNYATNTSMLGRLSGGVSVIPGFVAGETVSLVVIGWNSFMGGTTLAEFMLRFNSGSFWGIYGCSAVAHIMLGNSVNGGLIPDSTIFGITAGQIPGFVLSPITPEPSSFALFGLGGVVLLLSRRGSLRRSASHRAACPTEAHRAVIP